MKIAAALSDAGALPEELKDFQRNVSDAGRATYNARTEPIAALYEQQKVHHVGTFPTLEDQMCAFTSDFDRGRNGYSPDRVDALVWAPTELSGPQHTSSIMPFPF